MGELTLLNHSSLLIKCNGKYILTDPWHEKPAFTSWLPVFPEYIHPTYIASLGSSICILISHAHDDHCDDDLLKIFSYKTKFIVSNCESIYRRLKSLGFNDINQIESNGQEEINIFDTFHIRSFMRKSFTDEDSLYTIRCDDGVVIHANDCWPAIDEDYSKIIRKEIEKTSSNKGYIFSQTNSATGYPSTYSQYTEIEKQERLRQKVMDMIQGSIVNFKKLNLDGMFSYAGFSKPHLSDKIYDIEFTTSKYLNDTYLENSEIKYVDFYPGDVLNIKNGSVNKAFVSSDDYSDNNVKHLSDKYYSQYGIINKTDIVKEFSLSQATLEELIWFMEQLKIFSQKFLKKDLPDKDYKEMAKKSFRIKFSDQEISNTIFFSNEKLNLSKSVNKTCIVDSKIFKGVLYGKILFESLYVGYLAEWERQPLEIYNKDIILLVISFAYYYQNNLVKDYLLKFEDSRHELNRIN